MGAPAAPSIRILLVDDEARLTDLLKMELEVEGYEVVVAADGASGLFHARETPGPDLIVLDWNLPDFTGIDICQRIRTSGVTTPILMLTGHDDISDRVTALDAGVDDYLIKPFSIEELMARLRARDSQMPNSPAASLALSSAHSAARVEQMITARSVSPVLRALSSTASAPSFRILFTTPSGPYLAMHPMAAIP